MKKQSLYIILSVLLLSTVMNLVDVYLTPPYFLKSLIKLTLFLLAPRVYFLLHREELPQLKALLKPRKDALLLSLGLGLLCYGGIVGGYFLLRSVIDFSCFVGGLTQTSVVSGDFFQYVAIYICLCNSFLEEFFFRGFAYMTLKQHTGSPLAFWFSAAAFSFYHIGMTLGWVSPLFFLLGLAGLVMAGLFFNLLTEKTGSLYPSWLVHMFANLGINTVGFILFGMIG